MTDQRVVHASEGFSYEQVSAVLAAGNDTAWLFDKALFQELCGEMTRAFRREYQATQVAYSWKTNYVAELRQSALDLGLFAEVVSDMEYELALRSDVPTDRIILNGPNKSDDLLGRALLGRSIVNLDSLDEVRRVILLSAQLPEDRTYNVGLRCNFAVEGAVVSRFGIDVENGDVAKAVEQLSAARNVSLNGLHCHFSRARSAASFAERAERMLKVANEAFRGGTPGYLDIGGGMAGPMPDSLRDQLPDSPSFDDYATAVGRALAAAYPASPRPTLFVEPGVALAAGSMAFACRVVGTKEVRGQLHVMTTGSVFDINPLRGDVDLPIRHLSPTTVRQSGRTWTVGGSTCMEVDILHRSLLSDPTPGDILLFQNCGAYTSVFRSAFIRPAPGVVSVEADGGWTLQEHPGTIADVTRHDVGTQIDGSAS